MNNKLRNYSYTAIFGALLLSPAAFAQTSGTVSITATLGNTGSGPKHWTVVWVTKSDGTFVRTIRKQTDETDVSHLSEHLQKWATAANLASSTANLTPGPDGFTSATATTYAAPNSPFTQTWNCTDSKGAVIPDGSYKIWIQYAEDVDGAGPVTTNGLAWTKGAASSTVNPPNQGSNFTGMEIVWTPGTTPPPVTVPEIVVEQPVGSGLVDGTAKRSFGTVKVGKAGTAKIFTIKNTGTAKLTGLAITKKGVNAKDFVVTSPAAVSLAPGAKTTFKVTFKPKAKGTRSAAIAIKSNDADENPFDIKLSGKAVK